MMKKSQNTIKAKAPAAAAVGLLVLLWSLASLLEWVPRYMLPAPWEVAAAFVSEFPVLLEHSCITLQEAFYGLGIGVALGFFFAAAMDVDDGRQRLAGSLRIVNIQNCIFSVGAIGNVSALRYPLRQSNGRIPLFIGAGSADMKQDGFQSHHASS